MEIYNSAKKQLKYIRWIGRRMYVSWRWGAGALSQMPVVFGNAIPKSGSHLITQVLHGLSAVGPFVTTGFPPVNRAETNEKLSQNETVANLRSMRPGDIGYGYLGCEEPFLNVLVSPRFATIFVYRDPRDVIVSSVFYISEINRSHALHTYYKDRLQTVERCIAAEINGITEPGYEYSGVRTRFEKYIGWLDQPAVQSLRFEDLILDRENSINKLLGYLETRGAQFSLPRPQTIALVQSGMQSSRSGTFRKGQPGNWKEHFSEASKKLFKDVAGDILIKLGYEKDNNW